MKKAEIYCALTNLQGLFSLACAENRLLVHADELFADHPGLAVRLPDMDAAVCGTAALRACLADREAMRDRTHFDIHLFHTPAFQIGADLTTAAMTWDSYSYRIHTAKRTADFFTTRFHATLLLDGGLWRYWTIDWRRMQTFVPQRYGAEQKPAVQRSCAGQDTGAQFDGTAEAYLTIRNLNNLLSIQNWRDVDGLFCEDADLELEDLTDGCLHGRPAIARWAESVRLREENQGGCYRCLLMTGPGNITGGSGAHAHGVWLAQTFEVTPGLSGRPQTIHRRICVLDQRFCRQSGAWAIQRYTLHTLLELPMISGAGERYQRMHCPDGNWIPIHYDPKGRNPQAAFEVESMYAFWPVCLRRGELMQFFQNRIRNDTAAYWLHIRSQGPDVQKLIGSAPIEQKLKGMDACFRPHQPSYHCASTPVLEVSADGACVRASWIDHSLTNMGQAFGARTADGTVPYMVFVSRYDHVFQRIDGKWYLTQFNWEPCLGFPDWAFDPGKNTGWLASAADGKYPLPLNLAQVADYIES